MKIPLKPTLIAGLLVGVLILLAYGWSKASQNAGRSAVIYRGERFVVPAKKPAFTLAQAARVEQLLLSSAPIPDATTYQDLIKYHNELIPPGCGSSTGGFGEITPWGQFTYIAVQLPNKTQHRVIVYCAPQRDQRHYRPFDDFILSNKYPPELSFEAEGDQLAYRNERSREIIRRRPAPTATTVKP